MYSHETWTEIWSWPHKLLVKISGSYLNPIKSYDKNSFFSDFQKFQRAPTENPVTFPKLKISRQKFGI
jgi:hypothetical protein